MGDESWIDSSVNFETIIKSKFQNFHKNALKPLQKTKRDVYFEIINDASNARKAKLGLWRLLGDRLEVEQKQKFLKLVFINPDYT